MAERRAAQLHIEELHSRFERDIHPDIRAGFEYSLQSLSSEIYDGSTRFIQELLQNADDNEYRMEPTLRIIHRSTGTGPNWLQIDSNEVGFSRENVAALCTVGNSTKKQKSNSKEYTGEKGIGFKSVFKVANRVYISSLGYTFMFDKDLPYGMINPIWKAFPGKTTPELTSIGLELSETFESTELTAFLRNMDSNLLLFLRKLRRISIETWVGSQTVSSTTLQRYDAGDEELFQTRRLCSAEGELEYLIYKYRVQNLPYHEKRSNYTHSDLMLAFPLQSPARNQLVFSYLPVNDCGLNFALQGDFLLPANRQSIDTSAAWNRCLRDGVARAFKESIERFNSSDHPLKYHWPLFVPTEKIHAFFRPTKNAIDTILRNSKILVTQSVETPYAAPAEILFVSPDKYADGNGEPFTACSRHNSAYLSSRYPESSLHILCVLGVTVMTDHIFLSHLHQLIHDDVEDFYKRTTRWHSQLAQALLRLTVDIRDDLWHILYKLPIIPLSNGTWTSAYDRPVLPYHVSCQEDVPEGSANGSHGERNTANTSIAIIKAEDVPGKVLVVNEAAAADEMRRALFTQLRLVTMSTKWMCEHISTCHRSPSFDPYDWSLDQLLSHAKYIYHARWRPDKPIDLWVATSDGGRCYGSGAYCADLTSDDPVYSRIFEALKPHHPTIHQEYLQDGEVDWTSFLQTTLQISAIPRLAQSENSLSSPTLSKEFELILRECQISDVVQLILRNWHTYSEWLDTDIWQPDMSFASIARKLFIGTVSRQVKDTLVRTDHGTKRLGSTLLPGLDAYVEAHIPDLPTLALEIVIDKATKRKLSFLGIRVDCDIEFYTYCLEHLHAEREPDTTLLLHIYEQIQNRYDTDERLVETAFASKSLIYVKSASRKNKTSMSNMSHSPNTTSSKAIGWLKVSEAAQRKEIVQSEYPRAMRLFQELLGDDRALLGPLLIEAGNVDKSMTVTEIAKLFAMISDLLGRMGQIKIAKATNSLRGKSIFPIKGTSTSLKGPELYDALVGDHDTSWFIADRPHLRQSFDGKIPLLAFTVPQVRSMKHFISALGLSARQLSNRDLVNDSTVPRGPLRFNENKTDAVVCRAAFLDVLLSSSEPNRCLDLDSPDWIRISTAEAIIKKHELRHKGFNCSGRPTRGYIHSVVSDCSLHIYIEDDGDDSDVLSFDTVDAIGKFLGIQDERRRQLLHETLSDRSAEDILQRFEAEGYEVDVEKVLESNEQSDPDYHVASGDFLHIPKPWRVDNGKETKLTVDARSKRSKADPDRRIKMLDINRASESSTPGILFTTRLDPNNTRQFLGESLASQIFEESLGLIYDPNRHWTSKLRKRAGITSALGSDYVASFTMSGSTISQAMTSLLIRFGDPKARHWRHCKPTYHVLVAPSSGDWQEPFAWGSKKIELMRRFHFLGAETKAPTDVLILLRISHIYHSRPQYRFILDPWNLFISGQFTLPDDALFEAVIKSSASSEVISTGDTCGISSTAQADNNYAVVGCNLEPTPPRHLWSHLQPTPLSQSPLAMQQGSSAIYYPSPSQIGTTYYAYSTWPMYPLPGSYTAALHQWTPKAPDLHLNGVAQHELNDANYWSISSTSKKANRDQSRTGSNHLPRDIPDLARTVEFISGRYIYKPLENDQFRLFTLFPAKDSNEALRGMICSYPMDTDMPYQSVSYTWGPDVQEMHSISTPDGEVSIRDSLKSVLCRIRKKDGPVLLWIDAICIDQKQTYEKTQQICNLPSIFQHATSTLAVISTEDKYHAAMETLLQVRANAVYGHESRKWPKNLEKIPISWTGKTMPPSTDGVWSLVVQLFKSPWFERAWIVQEVVAAPTVKVVCGDWMIDWSDLFFAIELVDKELRRTSQVDTSAWRQFQILGEHREWEATNRRWPLIMLLETFRHTKSGFMRDRFFSLLGLAHDGHLPEFEPDYIGPFENIVCKFARTFIKRGFGVHVLCRAGLGTGQNRFPSWVPDWTVPKPETLSKSVERGIVYNASDNAEPKIEVVSESDNIIQVRAMQADEVTHVSTCFNRPHEPSRLEKYFKEIDKLIDDHLRIIFSVEKRNELKWRVPIAGAEHPRIATGGEINLRDSYNALRAILKGIKKRNSSSAQYLREDSSDRLATSSDGTELNRAQERSLNYHALVQDSIKDWKFFITSSGTCGIAPGQVEAGDKVYIVAGSRTPFVMRASNSKQQLFKLVGECYVYGMMDGEYVPVDAQWDSVKLH